MIKHRCIKVCHVAYQTWPSICGSVSRLENILESQVQKGLHVFVVSHAFQQANLSNIEDNNGIKYYRTNSRKPKGKIGEQRTFIARLIRGLAVFPFTIKLYFIVLKEKPDVIHAHATFMVGLPAWFVSRLCRTKIVYEYRSIWEENIRKGQFVSLQKYIIKFCEQFTGYLADGCIFVSEGIKQHYFSTHLSKTGIVVRNCVSPYNYKGTRPNWGEKNEKIFGYIGTLSHYEGLNIAIDAFESLKNANVPFKFIICGAGTEYDKLINEVKSRNLDNDILLLGSVLPAEIPAIYAGIDVIVLPRLSLPITEKVAGLKPVEAMANHKLLITSNVGGMLELIEPGKHALVFKAGSSKKLYEILMETSKPNYKFDSMTELGFNHYLKNYSIKSMGEKYLELYKSLL